MFVGWQISAGSPVDVLSVAATGLVFRGATGRVMTGNNCFSVWEAKAPPGGFASGTVITATFTAAPNTVGDIAGCSFTDLNGMVEVVNVTTGAGAAAWTNTLTTLQPNDVVLSFTMIDTTTVPANTPSSGTEIHDFWLTGRNRAIASEYVITTTPGPQTLSGTWSGMTGSSMNLTAAIAIRNVDSWITPMPWLPNIDPESGGVPEIGWLFQIAPEDVLVPPPSGFTEVTEVDIVLPFVGTKTMALATVFENDSVLPIAARKSRLISTALETDSVLAFGKSKVRAFTTVTEADTALALTRRKSRALAVVSETDIALALARRKTRVLAIVSEADIALAFGRSKRKALAIVTEIDLALPITRVGAIVVALATVTEADSALAFGKAKRKALVVVTEADLAVAFARTKRRTLGIATEADTVLAHGRAKRRAIGTATETDFALVITRSGVSTVVVGGQFGWITVF